MGASVKTIVIIVVLVILGALALDAFYIVDERQRAIVLRFGELTSGEEGENPGLHFKLPIADEVKYFDARVLTMDTPPQRYYTSEKKPLIVDSFVKWRVGDPPLYYTATSGEEETANGRLQDRVNEGLRNQIGRRTMHDVISGERDELMQELTNDLNRVMLAEFGISVLDVRVKKIDLPPEVSAAVFDRMNSERAIEARQYRAGGTEIARGITATADRESVVIEAEAYKEAEQIRGDGDAEAARIYAEAYNQDPDFYEFYRSINAYRTVFSDGNSLLVLDPSSEFFKYLKSESGD